MTTRPTDYASVVKSNVKRTTGFVLADSGACLDVQEQEVARVRRSLKALRSADLGSLAPPASWLLAVLLCPADELDGVAKWTRGLAASNRERVRFYHHPDCDLVAQLSPWYDAGLDDPRADEVRDFASFHRQFGADLNDQIYADAVAGVS